MVDVPETLVIDQPDGIRAMMNPVRLLAVTELYTTQTPQTATALASLCSVSPSAMSYHLRALQAVGIVQRADRTTDGRERPWLAAARAYTLSTEHGLDEGDQARLIDTYLEPVRARMRGVLARRARVSEEHRDTIFNVLSTGEFVLTEQQTRDFAAELTALVARYERLSWDDGADGPEDPAGETDVQPLVRSRYLWSLVPENPALYNLTDAELLARAAGEDHLAGDDPASTEAGAGDGAFPTP